MIAYVDRLPTVKRHNGHFLIEAISGDQTVQLILTRHALHGLQLRCVEAEAKQRYEELGFEVTPFQQKRNRDAIRAREAAES